MTHSKQVTAGNGGKRGGAGNGAGNGETGTDKGETAGETGGNGGKRGRGETGTGETGTDNVFEGTEGTAHVVFFRLEARSGLLPALAFSVDLVGRAKCDARA